MPKYTITMDSGDGPDGFDEPLEFPSAKAAAHDAKVALTEIARERIPDAEQGSFVVAIQDEDGQQVYRAGLKFEADDPLATPSE